MTTNSDQNVNDVLVLFPASKNFRPDTNINSPMESLKQEVEKKLDLAKMSCLESSLTAKSLSQVNDSLEIRLNVIEEISARLKFYLDDIESHLERK